jgi:hypothetical protein
LCLTQFYFFNHANIVRRKIIESIFATAKA